MSEGKKIILVEDDPDHADLITEVLEDRGNGEDVVLVRDGQEAIEYFQEFVIQWNGHINDKINLIILDLNLPKVCGMDVLKYLKADTKYHRIPVIILSTSSDKRTIDEAYANGVNGYIVKPVSYDDFVTKLEELKKYR